MTDNFRSLLEDVKELEKWATESAEGREAAGAIVAGKLYRLVARRLEQVIYRATVEESQRVRAVLNKMEARIAQLEKHHGMTSMEFAVRWAVGELPEETDYFEWRNALQGRRLLLKNYGHLLEEEE